MLDIEVLKSKIEDEILQLEFKKPPAELYDPISYTLQNQGKRIRPLLALMACQMFSEKIEKAMAPALGIEVFHNFTLLHDDLMDEAPVRRGKATVHKKWNANTAILSGDAMMIEAYKLVSKAPNFCLREVLNVFSETALEVCEGQMFDMEFETRDDVSEAEYIEMIRLKTSVLVAASLKVGALAGKSNIDNANLLYEFGIYLGLAFQVLDDWLDAFSDPKVFGKQTGGDIVVNKKTFLLIKALEKANGKDKEELEHWIAKEQFDEQEKIEAVKNIYKKLEIDKITINKAEELSAKAFECLDKINVPESQKAQLLALGKGLLKREK